MPTPRKYTAACPVHALYVHACKHCSAWAARMRRVDGPQVPRRKRLGTTGKTWKVKRRTHDDVLYAAALMRMRNEINQPLPEAT